VRYSKTNITEDNFDVEFEKMCAVMGVSDSLDHEEYTELPEGFVEQEAFRSTGESLGFSEHAKGVVHPDYWEGEVAYQFGNKFISVFFGEAH